MTAKLDENVKENVVPLEPNTKELKVDKDTRSNAPFVHCNYHPILTKSDSRYCVFPIEHPDLWHMYKKAVASFWTVEEIEFKDDCKEFNNLNPNERHFLKTILAFFAQSDGIVMENLAVNFSSEVNSAEARNFYAFQEAIEAIHNETYSLLIESLVTDMEERNEMFNALENFDTIKKKADWARKWINSDCPFAQRLCAFSMVEGVFFSGSFAAIYWIKQKKGILNALTFSNELISRDEGLHTDFACMLFKKVCPNPTTAEMGIVKQMMREAVEIESDFFQYALPCSLIGMNEKLMVQYVKFVADRLLKELIGVKIYEVENPFSFMDNIALEGKTNFFERRVGEYQKMGVAVASSNTFDINADF